MMYTRLMIAPAILLGFVALILADQADKSRGNSVAGGQPLAAAPARPADDPPGDPFACSGANPATGAPLSSRVVAPATIALCETATITTTLRAACGAPPLHIVVNVDRSGSMVGRPIEDARAAARAMVDALDLPANPFTRAALVSHGDPPTTDVPLTADPAALLAGIDDTLAVADADVPDNLPGAIDAGRRLLAEARRTSALRPIDVMVVLSDGGQSYAAPLVLDAAARARAAGILVVPVCVRNSLADCETLREIATRPDLAYEVAGTAGLAGLFGEIAHALRAVAIAELVVEETLPEGLALLPGSTIPVPEIGPGGRRLTWRLAYVPVSGVTLTYAVAPQWVDRFELAAPQASFRDPHDRLVTLAVPTAVVAVEGACGLETATPSPSPTPTPSATPSPTASPVATATPVPRPVFLPLLFRNQCMTRDRPVDVVLVIDASLSMGETTSAGRTKLAAAKDGARGFVTLMRAEDRAAVMAFNSGVDLLAGLTASRATLSAAVDRIALAPGTRIDVALYAAAAELAGPRRRPESRAVIVLLTDGRPTETTPPAVLAAAAAARGAGATIFAIGVGASVDRTLLVGVAGDAGRYFEAGDGEALGGIYRQISEKIPCP
jgi:Mg-chelatase subunit ChlD